MECTYLCPARQGTPCRSRAGRLLVSRTLGDAEVAAGPAVHAVEGVQHPFLEIGHGLDGGARSRQRGIVAVARHELVAQAALLAVPAAVVWAEDATA
jgi:hypothetical protein